LLNPWFALTIKAIQLGFDAQNVMALRMMRIASGGARGQSEARRMFTEKIGAGIEAKPRRLQPSLRAPASQM
jgi:hypothetical protein